MSANAGWRAHARIGFGRVHRSPRSRCRAAASRMVPHPALFIIGFHCEFRGFTAEDPRFAGTVLMVRSASSSCECEMSSMVTPRDLSSWMSPVHACGGLLGQDLRSARQIQRFRSLRSRRRCAAVAAGARQVEDGEQSRRCSICSSRMAALAAVVRLRRIGLEEYMRRLRPRGVGEQLPFPDAA